MSPSSPSPSDHSRLDTRRRPETGQATAEYALVLLGVAAVALAFVTWANSGKIGTFLDAVFDQLLRSLS